MDIKSQFPVFATHPNLIFLDSAASVQKPQAVLDATHTFSTTQYANIHRGGYELSLIASTRFEDARNNIAKFLGTTPKDLAFSKNGTEASNMIAHIFEQKILRKGDEILISISEHHANILPWMRAAKNIGASIIWVKPENWETGITEQDFKKHITQNTKVMVFAHVANVTGQIFPVKNITALAKNHNIFTVVDACQSVPHLPFHFEHLGIDAAFFTGHKLGAGGTGGMIINTKTIDMKSCSPFLLGGGIVQDVTEEGYQLLSFPENFESGTPNIENIIGLEAATAFLQKNDYFHENSQKILAYALAQFKKFLPNWNIVGPKNTTHRIGNISFYHPHIHHLDVSEFLSSQHISVRTGFHCANPLHHWLNIPGTVRASFWAYSTLSDIDALVSALQETENILG